jgi:hypothetical protein
MEAKFVIFNDASGQYRFRLVAPNGEIIAASEGYSTRQACLDGIEAVKKYAPVAKIEDKTASFYGR